MDQDLKPKGLKRQWWLAPIAEIAFSLKHGQVYAVEEALGLYQFCPSKNTAATCFRSFLSLISGLGVNHGLDLVVGAFEHGAEKYAPDNWKLATPDFRIEYFSAMCRHAFPLNGLMDEESGLPHAAHGACTALMICWLEKNYESGKSEDSGEVE